VELSGAVAVVTGASSGIGEATALALAREGARVVLAARRVERLEGLARWIRGRGGSALPVRCDVTEIGDLEALRDTVAKELDRCDVLVNNAGIPGGDPFEVVSLEQIERVTRVNYLGVVYATKLFLPMMLGQGRGHVVNVASIAGRFAAPGAAIYAASKHAVVAFSESLYSSTRDKGVLVTVVNPAFVDTEGFPAAGRPGFLTVPVTEVADTIVMVVREGIAPELSIPRWITALQAFRVLTPPIYRWGMHLAARVGARGR
jgi:NADP-dependent 3-hydroxy acid dehydrogenase YdfG